MRVYLIVFFSLVLFPSEAINPIKYIKSGFNFGEILIILPFSVLKQLILGLYLSQRLANLRCLILISTFELLQKGFLSTCSFLFISLILPYFFIKAFLHNNFNLLS